MTFDEAFDLTLGHEGGYINDPNDPGGETKWGISKRSYPDVDIKELTRDDARLIYRRDYWDLLPVTPYGEVQYQLFDFAVNSGVQTAIRYLQRAVGVADDGIWGPVSQEAISAMEDSAVVMALLAERLDFMTRLKNWPVHGKGWARRIAGNLRHGAESTGRWTDPFLVPKGQGGWYGTPSNGDES